MSDYKPLTITRTFQAPRQAVWDAWTTPEQFKQWYMPAPFSVPDCEMDVRPGGELKIETKSPDGVIMPLVGVFRVVEEPSKLVLTNAPLDAEGKPIFEIQHTIELVENGDQTVLTITAEVLTAGPNADQFLSGMEAGLTQAFEQLADLVAR